MILDIVHKTRGEDAVEERETHARELFYEYLLGRDNGLLDRAREIVRDIEAMEGYLSPETLVERAAEYGITEEEVAAVLAEK